MTGPVLDRLIVLTGGDPASAALAPRLPRGAYVIAADSGLQNAAALDLHVDLVVGDFDSVPPPLLADAERLGARLERHPEAKDRTDLALALDVALTHAPAAVTVVGGAGGRLDHHLANVLLLASEVYAPLRIEALMGSAVFHVVRDEVAFDGARGEHVTLLPVHGVATGVRTAGLLYPLDGDTLQPGSTRGVSNELVGGHAEVHVGTGTLLVIRPGSLGTHARALLTDSEERTTDP